ncbi:sugar phosphate isomerase/epimerase [Pseudorhodobacter sp.]|uniref:sugar phosphate isomerase/epimerase family protein n=1 Tax=Pseudorhodobacter sp. TaxID=1934400 RepID=UPI0026479C8E|nr:sugar phosphate isomerase/epimerase family protein [Pseudorhodobacter sp.]MDN5788478.1 sugar phosphate isomerase/epimerase [Pseudorhodobacter sp.]
MKLAVAKPSAAKPVLGAALTLDMLELHRGWMLAAPRDLELQSFCLPHVLNGDLSVPIARAKKLIDGLEGRIGIHGPYVGFSIDTADPDVAVIVQKRMLKALEVCEALMADQMVIHSPITSWDHGNQMASAHDAMIQIERVRFTLGPVLKRAEDTGVGLVLENIEDIDPAARCRMVDALNSPALKVSLDTGHAQYAHVTTAAPPVDAYVMAAGKRLDHVHLQDSDGFADRHWHPGDGPLNWRAIFTALHALPKMPRLILEVNDLRHVRRGAENLAALGLAE